MSKAQDILTTAISAGRVPNGEAPWHREEALSAIKKILKFTNELQLHAKANRNWCYRSTARKVMDYAEESLNTHALNRVGASLRGVVGLCLSGQGYVAKPEVDYLSSEEVEPYERALGKLLSAEGVLVLKDHDLFSWEDSLATGHYRSCGAAWMDSPEHMSWEHFEGSFVDNGVSYGMESKTACICGLVAGTVRLEGDFTDLTRKIVNEYA